MGSGTPLLGPFHHYNGFVNEDELQTKIDTTLAKPQSWVTGPLKRAMALKDWPRVRQHVLKYGVHVHKKGNTWHCHPVGYDPTPAAHRDLWA